MRLASIFQQFETQQTTQQNNKGLQPAVAFSLASDASCGSLSWLIEDDVLQESQRSRSRTHITEMTFSTEVEASHGAEQLNANE